MRPPHGKRQDMTMKPANGETLVACEPVVSVLTETAKLHEHKPRDSEFGAEVSHRNDVFSF
jgi:hypothetical protein